MKSLHMIQVMQINNANFMRRESILYFTQYDNVLKRKAECGSSVLLLNFDWILQIKPPIKLTQIKSI